MSKKLTAQVRVTRQISASPERVFDAWLDPKKAGKFLFATATGQMVRAGIDPSVGGKFIFVDRRDGEDVEHTGEYLEIDRPRRLVFQFALPQYSPDSTQVTVEIEPLGKGSQVTLTHDGVDAEYESRTEDGWTRILDGLARAVE
jgi:uncharacterized protein YndB with AHSA1/START domain